MNISFFELREANGRRAIEWNPSGVSLGPLFAAVELAGEVGELLNELKKRERHSRGLKGGKDDPQAIAMELADVVICVDLLARELGVDLSEAVVAKFNSTSEKHGFATRLSGDHDLVLRVAELEESLKRALDKWPYKFVMVDGDARIAALEAHLAACKAECRAWRLYSFNCSRAPRDLDAVSDAQQAVLDSRKATDAAGGVS